jgi:hypothetical membrane protein
MPLERKEGSMRLRAGLWGAPIFLASLFIFGALTPGYSHLHQAVSELGGQGTPWGAWFNGFGFFLPGALATGVALEFRRQLRTAGAETRWATGLVIYTVMLALSAIPADFQRMFASPWTSVHAFFVLGNAMVLFTVLPGCTKALCALGASRQAANIFLALGYLPAAEFFLYGVFRETPGLVQRLMIVTAHVTIAWLSGTLIRLARPDGEIRTAPRAR